MKNQSVTKLLVFALVGAVLACVNPITSAILGFAGLVLLAFCFLELNEKWKDESVSSKPITNNNESGVDYSFKTIQEPAFRVLNNEICSDVLSSAKDEEYVEKISDVIGFSLNNLFALKSDNLKRIAYEVRKEINGIEFTNLWVSRGNFTNYCKADKSSMLNEDSADCDSYYFIDKTGTYLRILHLKDEDIYFVVTDEYFANSDSCLTYITI